MSVAVVFFSCVLLLYGFAFLSFASKQAESFFPSKLRVFSKQAERCFLVLRF